MMNTMKQMARPFGALFACALIIAVLGRIGLFIMAQTGVLAFDYISSSDVPMLDIICSILTGSAFVAFLFTASLALCVSCAGCVLYGFLYWRGTEGSGHALPAFLWGWATALVAIVCLGIVASGILSAVQMSSMSSKLPGVAVIVAGIVVFSAFLGTLLGAASQVVCACVAHARTHGSGLGWRLCAACAVCGFAVMLLTIGTFNALNQLSINTVELAGWFAGDVVVNVAIMLVASMFVRKAEGAKTDQS